MRCDECPDATIKEEKGRTPGGNEATRKVHWCKLLNMYRGKAMHACPKPKMVYLVEEGYVYTFCVDGATMEIARRNGDEWTVILNDYVDYAGDLLGLLERYPYMKDHLKAS